MYNSEIKEKFIEYIQSGKNSEYTELVVKIFTISEPMENKMHKDLVYFSKKEFLDLYSRMELKSLNVYKRRKWLVNQYLKWYSELYEQIPSIKFTSEEVDSIILQRAGWNYFSDASIKRLILNYYSKTTGFIVYALYYGVHGKNLEELCFMKISDIDTKTKTVKLYSYDDKTKERSYQREILVDDVFLDLAKQANLEQTYTDDTGRELGRLEKTDYIIKRREGSLKATSDNIDVFLKSKYKLITKRVQRVNDNDSFEMKDLTIISIRYSGLINYLKKLAKNLEVIFDHENMVENIENRVMLRKAAKHYNLPITNVERILEDYFQLII